MAAEKRPRHYAAELIKIESGAERLKGFKKIPEDIQPAVELHLKIFSERISFARRQEARRQEEMDSSTPPAQSSIDWG